MNQETSNGEAGRLLPCSALLDGTTIKNFNPFQFVQYVRYLKEHGKLSELCDREGAKYGAGISNTRHLGNLCEAIYGKQKRGEYLAAFFAV